MHAGARSLRTLNTAGFLNTGPFAFRRTGFFMPGGQTERPGEERTAAFPERGRLFLHSLSVLDLGETR